MNKKEGLDFFLLSTRTDDDDKMKIVEATFGLKGFAVVIKLWQQIYADKGYYKIFDQRAALMFSKDCGLGVSAVLEIVKLAVKEGLFDREMYETHAVLTSAGIQKRYFDAVKRRKDLQIDRRFLLACVLSSPENANISSKNANISPENANILLQKREEKETATSNYIKYCPSRAREEIPEDLIEYYAAYFEEWCRTHHKVLPDSIVKTWYSEDLAAYGPEALRQRAKAYMAERKANEMAEKRIREASEKAQRFITDLKRRKV